MRAMKKTGTTVLCLALFLAFAATTAGAGMDIVGTWKNEAAEKGTATFQIRIREKDGVFFGKIEYSPDAPAEARCADCDESKKNRPLAGMVVLWGMKKSLEKEEGCDLYTGGRILDAGTGKDYPCTIRLMSDGRLRVRRYVLFFYKTQYWSRVR
jgi:uncharacterized protein (DUF2147 family)